jgi:hypothetical protein
LSVAGVRDQVKEEMTMAAKPTSTERNRDAAERFAQRVEVLGRRYERGPAVRDQAAFIAACVRQMGVAPSRRDVAAIERCRERDLNVLQTVRRLGSGLS